MMGRHSERMPKLLKPQPNALRIHSELPREEPNPDALRRHLEPNREEPNPDAPQRHSAPNREEPNPDAPRRPFPVREGLKEIIVGGDG